MEKIIKIILIINAMLFVTIASSQEKHDRYLYLQITQDVKLAFLEDNYGNIPITLDVSIKAGFKGLERNIGHIKIELKYEYADLYGGVYKRTSFGGGYVFTHLPLPFTNYKYKLGTLFNFGLTDRYFNNPDYSETGLFSYEGEIEIAFPVFKGFDVVVLLTYTTRPELPDKFGTPNFSIGVEYSIKLKAKSKNKWRR